MSFADCIKRAVDAKEADGARGEAATDLWKEMADDYERMGYTRHQAETLAGENVKAVLKRGLQQKRHMLASRLGVEARNARMAQSLSPKDLRQLPIRMLEAGLASGVQSDTVAGMRDALLASFHGDIADLLAHHMPDIWNRTKDKAGLRDVAREIHGEATGNAKAKAYAAALSDVFERSRLMFNSHGGDIGKIENYFPHIHSRDKIMAAGKDAWVNSLIQSKALDWTRIEDRLTGKPFSRDGTPPPEAAQRNFLGRIADNIIKDGWNSRQVQWNQPLGSALHNRHSDPRVLHFKSADAWLEYNDAFGEGDVFGAITGHLHRMARDIAMMRVLGPNHNAGLENVYQHAMKRLAGTKDAEKLDNNIAVARAMLSELSGAANAPQNAKVASIMGSLRGVLTSAHLGSAVLVSGSDSVAMSLAAKTMGMNDRSPVAEHVRLMSSSVAREEARKMGYVADTMSNVMAAQQRFIGEELVTQWAQGLSGFVMRAQGLSFWTDYAKIAMSLSYEAEITGKSLEKLSEPMREALTKRGITAEDWGLLQDPSKHFTMGNGDTILNLKTWREKALMSGVDAVRVERIYGTVKGLQQEIVARGIPTVGYEMRGRVAAVGGNARPGSIPGEVQKSFLAYKSYTLAFTGIQMQQMFARNSPMSRFQYLTYMIAGFTVAGAVGVQLKELAKGNDPRPMDDPAFWGAAALQGGGFGILGDLFSSSTTRLGGGLAGWFGGPVVGFASDAGMLVGGNAMDAIQGKDTNLARDAIKFGERYVPGTTLWQVRAAVDRGVADAMHMMLDPDAASEIRRAEKRQMRDYGNGRWFPADAFGSGSDDFRLPDLTAILSN